MNRTTVFSSITWRCDVEGNVISLRRLAADHGTFDMPWSSANLYEIKLPNK